MAEDNFDIDIYGDGGEEYNDANQDSTANGSNPHNTEAAEIDRVDSAERNVQSKADDSSAEQYVDTDQTGAQKGPLQAMDTIDGRAQSPNVQSLKRKESASERPLEPGATAALFISELQWWITDDDIRGWANQSGFEDELHEITFSEHKVNGKSKGQAYALFSSPQAANATKQTIESSGEGQKYVQKFSVNFTNPSNNPFKTLPKDGSNRGSNQGSRAPSSGYSSNGGQQGSFTPNNNFRGGRGGYNNRGNMGGGGYARGGFQQPIANNFAPAPMNGFAGPAMGGMQPYGGFANRGGMMGGNMRGHAMGIRGGRGGMGPNGMMPMQMSMNMGGMPGAMAGMGIGMPQVGMQGNGYPNPGFFQPHGQVAGDGSWNPHGAKRTRQE